MLGSRLISVEGREVGSVSWAVYKHYAMAIGGTFLVFLILGLYVADQAAQVASSWYYHIYPHCTITP